MSTCLNGFHMYADEMARQVEHRISAFTCVMTCTSA
jgi:hypothetical protein